jgi:hypothetical protein
MTLGDCWLACTEADLQDAAGCPREVICDRGDVAHPSQSAF